MKIQLCEWLGWVSQGCEMYCGELEVMGSNPSRVELGVRSTSKSYLNPKVRMIKECNCLGKGNIECNCIRI